ncbi:MAG: hypothetical protein CMM84_06550 [Rhodothermaceae bacterium]|nr:hypothetical protein [Rhodothermaceae bacterium]MBC15143.1 hypothetical protein [Rhodothermaceae bacterium]
MPASRLRSLGAALLLAAVGGCDFTPALDIDTPAYEPGLVLRAVLAADSTVSLRVTESRDPYGGRLYLGPTAPSADATVTLLRDGQPVETLVLRPDVCDDYSRPPGPDGFPPTFPCGPYQGTTRMEAGATYTFRVDAAGYPTATATVTIPRRPTLTATQEGDGADRRFRVRLTDPAGLGDLYGLSLLRDYTYTSTVTCDPDTGECTEMTETTRLLNSFTTSDPVLLSASVEIDGNITFVVFQDQTFDGQEKTFTMARDDRYGPGDAYGAETVQVAALSGDVYDAYRIEYFSGGDENPFAEPINLPSNVVGGYGLVGAVTLAEVTFEAEAP